MVATLENTIGAAYIGIIISAVFFGVTCVQAYVYALRYPCDWKIHQVSVAALWLLDAFHLVLTSHIGYHYWVTGFGNVAGLHEIVWTLKLQIVIGVVIIVLVQSLYAARVWKLASGHKHTFLPCLVIIVVAAGYAVGTTLAYFIYQVKSFNDIESISWSIKASFGTSTGIDFVIAASMCYYLRKTKNACSNSDGKIATLIQYTLGSGVLTSACSTCSLVAFCIMPDNLIFLAIEFSLTKLYINSFLAMLNARKDIRERDEEKANTVSMNNLRTVASFASPGSISFFSATDSDFKNFSLPLTFPPRDIQSQSETSTSPPLSPMPLAPLHPHHYPTVVLPEHINYEAHADGVVGKFVYQEGKSAFQWTPERFGEV